MISWRRRYHEIWWIIIFMWPSNKAAPNKTAHSVLHWLKVCSDIMFKCIRWKNGSSSKMLHIYRIPKLKQSNGVCIIDWWIYTFMKPKIHNIAFEVWESYLVLGPLNDFTTPDNYIFSNMHPVFHMVALTFNSYLIFWSFLSLLSFLFYCFWYGWFYFQIKGLNIYDKRPLLVVFVCNTVTKYILRAVRTPLVWWVIVVFISRVAKQRGK